MYEQIMMENNDPPGVQKIPFINYQHIENVKQNKKRFQIEMRKHQHTN